MQRITGLTILLGVILFLAALVVPVTTQVFGSAAGDAALQTQIIAEARGSWQLASALFALGGLVAACGLIFLARELDNASNSNSLRWSSYAAAALAFLGSLLWALVNYYRMTLDPAQLGGNLNGNDWMFPVYTVLTNIALLLLAFSLLQAGLPRWLAGTTALFGLIQLGTYFYSGDAIPAVNYFPLLVLGLALAHRSVASRLAGAAALPA